MSAAADPPSSPTVISGTAAFPVLAGSRRDGAREPGGAGEVDGAGATIGTRGRAHAEVNTTTIRAQRQLERILGGSPLILRWTIRPA